MTNQEDEDQDPLKRLLLDKDSINREKLTDALHGYIGIDQDSAEPVFRAGFESLKDKQKVVAYLLYRKATVALGLEISEEEGVTSKKLADEVGVKYNTTRSILSRESYIESSDAKGGYLIPGYAMNEAIEVMPDGN